VAVGIWLLLYPEGVLVWVRNAHPTLDVEDKSIWWVPRIIGCVSFVLAIFAGVVSWR